MSAAEFDEWVVFSRLHPFGEWRADVRMAMMAALVANIFKSKDSDPPSLDDFMPKFSALAKADTVRSPEEWEALLVTLNAAFGGRDLREKADE